uniref:Uncharacterized protein n=1 Tax=Meloidogyne enterolobii TaxID=390850 RepID=A0A6V7X4T6_MELEN|nr:unnamed protein product [Meloidogyne enterolobii]
MGKEQFEPSLSSSKTGCSSKTESSDRKRTLKRSTSDAIFLFEKRPKILPIGDECDPFSYLKAAEYYYNKKDLVQSSRELWKAASYAVKILFLKINVNITSMNGLEDLCYYAIDKSTVYDQPGIEGSMARQLAKDQFSAAMTLECYNYGSKIKKWTYEANKEDVVEFVQNFMKIKDYDKIKKNLMKFLKNWKYINFKCSFGTVKLGNEKYYYTIECW